MNFVLQATNMQGLGMRLGHRTSIAQVAQLEVSYVHKASPHGVARRNDAQKCYHMMALAAVSHDGTGCRIT